MTSGTLLPSGRWSAGIGPGSTRRPCCPGCPPTSGTGSRASLTGITHRHPRAARSRRSTPGGRPGDDPMTVIAPTLESWFTDRLGRQRQASPRTIASYRDTLRLLMCFMQARTGKAPSSLDWDDLNEEAISAFLDHLETDRHNGPRTRNLRLTAIRSLFRYAALRH